MSASAWLAAVVAATLLLVPELAHAKPDARPPRPAPPSTQRAAPKPRQPSRPATRAAPRRLDPRDVEVVRNLRLLKEIELLEVLDLLIQVKVRR